ncbi:MAG: AAA family ATPase [Candidatus Hermodarchaeota archaeon]
MNIQRIAIIGNTASGKSCLSVKLSKELKIPVFHLDKYLWKPGWVRVPEDEFTASHNELISKDFWIIDGVAYFSTMEKRLSAADVILYSDLDPAICKKRALKRMQEEKIRPNPYTNGCPYNETPENIEAQNNVIDSFQNDYKLKLDPLVKSFEKKKIVIYIRDEIETEELFIQIMNQLSGGFSENT